MGRANVLPKPKVVPVWAEPNMLSKPKVGQVYLELAHQPQQAVSILAVQMFSLFSARCLAAALCSKADCACGCTLVPAR